VVAIFGVCADGNDSNRSRISEALRARDIGELRLPASPAAALSEMKASVSSRMSRIISYVDLEHRVSLAIALRSIVEKKRGDSGNAAARSTDS